MSISNDIDSFLDKKNIIAVVGVSENPEKWGRKIYETLKSEGYKVYPINPKHEKIGEDRCYPDLTSLPEKPDVVIFAVKSEVTENVLPSVKKLGIKRAWLQPGSESEKAIEFCKENGIEVVWNMCFVVDGLKIDFVKL